jgi:hypothetical protein
LIIVSNFVLFIEQLNFVCVYFLWENLTQLVQGEILATRLVEKKTCFEGETTD